MLPAVSIVIVSRHRPEFLRRCLIGLSQLDYDPFEIVIVADPSSCVAMRAVPQAAQAKLIRFDEANISAARNLGINSAAGEIIAFIDDDSVPEPSWLRQLVAPFARAEVAASGGFVRGRNGISWQHEARSVDVTGYTEAIKVDPDTGSVFRPTEDKAIRTEGTNMAVRRSVLVDIGGFDPGFRFFLDETDLNMRLAKRGLCTAIVPRAEVHHGFAASARRRRDRTPSDLTEIGSSWSVFLDKHCPPDRRQAAWHRERSLEQRRLIAHMVRGTLEPRDVRRMMGGLDRGYGRGGSSRSRGATEIGHIPSQPFRPSRGARGAASILLSGRFRARRRLRQEAKAQVLAGNIVTVIQLSLTTLYHKVVFVPDGYWLQTGGVFGKSIRKQKTFTPWTFHARVLEEARRVAIVRGLR